MEGWGSEGVPHRYEALEGGGGDGGWGIGGGPHRLWSEGWGGGWGVNISERVGVEAGW